MKLKPFVFPFLFAILVGTIVISMYFTFNNKKNEDLDIDYVSSVILDDGVPVIENVSYFTNPYNDSNISIYRYYYNKNDDDNKKTDSIIYYNNTYMPNTGVDYISDNVFDILSIYSGTVTNIKEDEVFGIIVEVTHDNQIVSTYSGIKDVCVKVNDIIDAGTKIGISSSNKLNSDKNNQLHLEIFKEGKNIDPLKVIGNKLGDF